MDDVRLAEIKLATIQESRDSDPVKQQQHQARQKCPRGAIARMLIGIHEVVTAPRGVINLLDELHNKSMAKAEFYREGRARGQKKGVTKSRSVLLLR